MRVMSLFAGIGGFDLAAEWMQWDTVVQVEIDEWCRKVLAKNFPNATRYEDIRTFDATTYRGHIELVCGGFPCQPVSLAGRRKGKADDRFLWPEMLRVIREVAPRWVVGENVSGLLSQDAGLVFESVLVDLEAEGYTVWTYLLPACGVNAPHKRDRIWIIAHANRDGYGRNNRDHEVGRSEGESEGDGDQRKRLRSDVGGISTTPTPTDSAFERCETGDFSAGRQAWPNPTRSGNGSTLANADRDGQQQPERAFEKVGRWTRDNGERIISHTNVRTKFSICRELGKVTKEKSLNCNIGGNGIDANTNGARLEEFNTPGLAARPGQRARPSVTDWSNWPTQPPICPRNDGVSAELVRSARLRIRAFAQWRARVIKAAGNAIVPQVAYQIFQAIELINNQ